MSETEGRHKCGSCLQWVGTYMGETRPYRRWQGNDGREHILCADKEVCERRWRSVNDAEQFAASEARTYFPEDSDGDEL